MFSKQYNVCDEMFAHKESCVSDKTIIRNQTRLSDANKNECLRSHAPDYMIFCDGSFAMDGSRWIVCDGGSFDIYRSRWIVRDELILCDESFAMDGSFTIYRSR